MRYYHMIIERKAGWDKAPEDRKEYISTRQGAAPEVKVDGKKVRK